MKYRSCAAAAAVAVASEGKNWRCVPSVSFSFGLRGRRRRRRGTTRQAFPLRAALPSRPTLRPGTSRSARSAQESRLHRTPTPNITHTFPSAIPPPPSSPPPASVSSAHPIRAISHASARRRPVSSIKTTAYGSFGRPPESLGETTATLHLPRRHINTIPSQHHSAAESVLRGLHQRRATSHARRPGIIEHA